MRTSTVAMPLAVLVPCFRMIARDITRDCEVLLTLAFAIFGVACTTIARADAHANDRCAAQQLVRQRVEQQVGAWPARAVAIEVAEHDGQLRLTLDTERDGVHGTRVFEGPTCDEVVDAAVLLLVLMLDEQQSEPPARSPAPTPSTPKPAAPKPERRVRATARAAALGEQGYLPRVGAGAELGVGTAFGRSRIELHGLWLAAVHSARNDEGARVRIGLWAARLGYCHHLLGRSLALFGCLGLELGRASGAGEGLTQQRERAYSWRAGQVALRASLALGRGVSLQLEPALAVPFARRRFVSVDADGASNDILHTPAPVSGRVAIALEAAF